MTAMAERAARRATQRHASPALAPTAALLTDGGDARHRLRDRQPRLPGDKVQGGHARAP